jgi:hypothetical protein
MRFQRSTHNTALNDISFNLLIFAQLSLIVSFYVRLEDQKAEVLDRLEELRGGETSGRAMTSEDVRRKNTQCEMVAPEITLNRAHSFIVHVVFGCVFVFNAHQTKQVGEDAELLAERLNTRAKGGDELASLREKHRKELLMDRKVAEDVMSEVLNFDLHNIPASHVH